MWDDFDISTGQVNVAGAFEKWKTFNTVSHTILDLIDFAEKRGFNNTRYYFNGNRFEVGWQNGLVLFCRYVEYDVPEELVISKGSKVHIPVILKMFKDLTEQYISEDETQSIHYGIKSWDDEPFVKKVRPREMEFRNILYNKCFIKNQIRDMVVRWLGDIGYVPE